MESADKWLFRATVTNPRDVLHSAVNLFKNLNEYPLIFLMGPVVKFGGDTAYYNAEYTLIKDQKIMSTINTGMWWRIGRVDNFQPEGPGFDSRSSRHIGTLGKSLTHSCLWRFSVKLRHSIRAVSGALLSRSGLEEAL